MRVASLLTLIAIVAPMTAAAAQDAAKKPDPERQICRRVQATGTILGGKKECHTRSEWNRMSEEARNRRDNSRDNSNGLAGSARGE